jgi:hypothetical protein
MKGETRCFCSCDKPSWLELALGQPAFGRF